jgi:hypothetical protein
MTRKHTVLSDILEVDSVAPTTSDTPLDDAASCYTAGSWEGLSTVAEQGSVQDTVSVSISIGFQNCSAEA